jgi:monofunctional biosynthetic peptidoglycan transglycosylase
MQRAGSFLLRLIAQVILWFLGLSLMAVIVFAFVPVPVTATMLLDENGAARDWEPLENIDRDLVDAVIAAEDARFCQHAGFDTEAIRKAYEENQRGGRIRGGSTISQQTAKNVFLWQGGGYARKGLEAWFTFWVENVWGKRRIMEVYLNVAETGIGTYGAAAGAQRYFDRSAANLTPSQAARMAAALPQPKKRAVKNPGGWLARHGRRIERSIADVRAGGLDQCVYPDE